MRNLESFIARRYLVSPKSYSAINYISYISILGVAIGTMALVVVLSVYNGFDDFIRSMYNSFDPDLRIELVQGKVFNAYSPEIQKCRNLDGIGTIAPVLEETSLLEFNGKQTIAKMKGVDSLYRKVANIDSSMVSGFYAIPYLGHSYACLGLGVAYRLGINLDYQHNLQVWMPKRGKKISYNPAESFNQMNLVPSGVFSFEPEFDSQYFYVPLDFAQKILDYDSTKVSQLEVRIAPKSNPEKLKQAVEKILGSKYRVQNKYQQREVLYKVLQSERWAIYLILFFILIVASFNILASLTMLIIDKRRDIQILQSIGAKQKLVRNIFLLQGWMITALGAITGLILGYFVVFIQAQFKLIKFPGNGQLLLDAYPVKAELSDFILVLVTVAFVGFVATVIPARVIIGRFFRTKV